MNAPTVDASCDALMDTRKSTGFARAVRRLAVPIILAWVAVSAVLNIAVPQLGTVAKTSAVSLTPDDAPSVVAMSEMGGAFAESSSNSSAMLVLEGQQQLGVDARRFYDQIIDKLKAEPKYVEHVQDFWNDPLTAAGAQSADGKAVYAQLFLAGREGEALANEAVQAVQGMVDAVAPPPGVKAYVTGQAALVADQQTAADRSLQVMQLVTFVVIAVMLLFFFRSIVTVVLVLLLVGLSLAAARGVVAFLGYLQIIGLSPFATSLLLVLAVASSTDYAIFLIGRYQEARGSGQDSESAFFTMFRGTASVVLGSGLTIAGGLLCLHFTRLPYFQSLAIPLALGLGVVVAAALTLGTAVVAVSSRFGLLEPRRSTRVRGWRKIGAAVVRWPVPILVVAIGLSLIGLLTLPGYQTSYSERRHIPADLPSTTGYVAADRHFPQAQMNPEVLMIENDRDMRNPADLLVIRKVAKAILDLNGIARVQAITRPQGSPIKNTSIAAEMSMQTNPFMLNIRYIQDRMADMLRMGDEMQFTIDSMNRMLTLMEALTETTHSLVGKVHTMYDDFGDLRDHLADFNDFFRPLRSYFYWEPHCFDVPLCWSIRAVFDTLDGVDVMTQDLENLLPDLDRLDQVMPQLVANLSPMIDTLKVMRKMLLTMQATMSGFQDQLAVMIGDGKDAAVMRNAFNTSKNDDSFYLPPGALKSPDFQGAMKMFFSPNGHAARLFISHLGDPVSAEAVAHSNGVKVAARKAMIGTPLEGSRIYLAGTAPFYKDIA